MNKYNIFEYTVSITFDGKLIGFLMENVHHSKDDVISRHLPDVKFTIVSTTRHLF